MKLLISPHTDDETLFSAFTIQREKPQVVIVYDSYIQVQRGHAAAGRTVRRNESIAACKELGVAEPIFLGFDDSADHSLDIEKRMMQAFRSFENVEAVWCPASEWDGHQQHNIVASICDLVFMDCIEAKYLTYTRSKGKSTSSTLVKPDTSWIIPKLKALACYKTQIEIVALGCWPHFLRDQNEYYV